MEIVEIGLSHQTAPVEIREQLALSEAAVPEALRVLCSDNGDGHQGYASEGAILSTCNRLEVYAVVERAVRLGEDLCEYLARVTGAQRSVFQPHLQVREGESAVAHLCEVASGLDSMVLGESQIQGQVAEAQRLAMAQGAAGPVINALFRTALQASKRARTETEIGTRATSIGQIAVELALQIFGDVTGRTAMVVGAGEMAELAARHLVYHGVAGLLLVNRSAARAAALVAELGGQALGWESLSQALRRSDIVISSTAAPHPILGGDLVSAAMRVRRNRPLVIIDIAVPRDVDPAVRRLANVFLYDIDDLHRAIAANLKERQRQVPRVRSIIREEVVSFHAWLKAREMVPTVVELRRHVDEIREGELAWAMNKLDGLSDRERRIVSAFSRRLVNKILHRPSVQLRQQAPGSEAQHYARAIRHLFGLGDGCGPEG